MSSSDVQIFENPFLVPASIFLKHVMREVPSFQTRTLVIAASYIWRLPDTPSLETIHRLLIVALVVADKTDNDFSLLSSDYAEYFGVKTRCLNRLESWFLFMLEFRLEISWCEYVDTVGRILDFPGKNMYQRVVRALLSPRKSNQREFS